MRCERLSPPCGLARVAPVVRHACTHNFSGQLTEQVTDRPDGEEIQDYAPGPTIADFVIPWDRAAGCASLTRPGCWPRRRRTGAIPSFSPRVALKKLRCMRDTDLRAWRRMRSVRAGRDVHDRGLPVGSCRVRRAAAIFAGFAIGRLPLSVATVSVPTAPGCLKPERLTEKMESKHRCLVLAAMQLCVGFGVSQPYKIMCCETRASGASVHARGMNPEYV